MSETGQKKKIHPREDANFLSLLFFWWVLPFFYKGYKKIISENDLYGPLEEHRSDLLGNKLEEAWSKEISLNTDPSLWRVLTKIFGLEFLKWGFLLVPAELIFKLSQPLLIGKLINYYSNENGVSKKEAYIYTFSYIFTYFLYFISYQTFLFNLNHLSLKMRVAVSSLIYRKLLKLKQSSLSKNSAGQIVNLLSNDLERFDKVMGALPFFLVAPLQLFIVFGILYWMLGPSALIGIGIFFVFFLAQIYLFKKVSVYRMRIALKTDQRVRLMDEIIRGIKIIKMFTWEKTLAKLVEKARKSEMAQIRMFLHLRAFVWSCPVFLVRTTLFCCILIYISTGGTLNPKYVYVLSSLYDIVRKTLIIHFQAGLIRFGETVASVHRIKNFLTQTEASGAVTCSCEGIVIDNVSVKWNNSSLDNALTDLSLRIEPNQLIALIGSVGSGKSTLLQVILKEILPLQGSVQVGGSVSYASQVPWIYDGSIRDNILFGEEFEKSKYDQVVKVCELEFDFSLLPFGDQSLVGERGAMLSGGQKARVNLARAIYRNVDFYLLDDPLSGVDTQVGAQLFKNCIKGYLRNKTRILVTHQLQFLESADVIYLFENGRVVVKGTYHEFVNKGTSFLKMLECQRKGDTDNENIEDKNEIWEPVKLEDFQEKGAISNRVYRDYFSAVGGTFLSGAVVILLQLLLQVVANSSDFFLLFWLKMEKRGLVHVTDQYLHIYAGLILFVVVIALLCALYSFNFCVVASFHLHNRMFRKIIDSPMRFFNTNPSGRILNRFSKDMGLIDEDLPPIMIGTMATTFHTLAIVTMISAINPWMLIPTLVILILFWYWRKIFLATSRNLKRTEARTRSPIYTQVSASLEGLVTIRAANAQNNLQNEFDKHQDLNSSFLYMFQACSSTMSFWSEFICLVYFAIVIISFLFMDARNNGANFGLSITQCMMMNGMIQWGLRQSSELENQMTSVERVIEYSQLPSEPSSGTKVLPPPKRGRIEFRAVSLRYSPENPLVLKQVTFETRPNEKIGIVGRTGAGKSSLTSALFRLAEFEGDVLIDDIDIKTVSLESLRSQISIIPQEPVLFTGTIRYNLDPFEDHEDSQLWDALEEVEMKRVVFDSPSGLSTSVLEGGSNFSVGQKQLLCLARTLIRRNKILILDEATANVDPQTDELIQKTIRIKFKECTVLTIAHRLNTVMDCDRILVMDKGSVVEFDQPTKLLEKRGEVFYQLAKESDAENSTPIH